MAITVCKFGGSSLADAKHFEQVSKIVKSDPSRRFIVPSAPGKRFPGDEKVTDVLYRAAAEAEKGGDPEVFLGSVFDRFEEIIVGLGMNLWLESEFDSISNASRLHIGRDFFASRGEYFSGMILSNLLGYEFIDPVDYFFFNDDGSFNYEKTNTYLSEKLSHTANAVIPGFYGMAQSGFIKTFPRGGSDITGAIVARAAKADLYENWTDVSGILAANPMIVDNALPIPEMNYSELREMSVMGASVLHEDAVLPAKLAGIPINIRNTGFPDDPGTVIAEDKKSPVCGITGKEGYVLFTIKKENPLAVRGFAGNILSVFESYNITPEHLFTGTDCVFVFVKESAVLAEKERIKDSLSGIGAEAVFVSGPLALIAAVGGKCPAENASIAASALEKNGIEVYDLQVFPNSASVHFAVDNKKYRDAVTVLYGALACDHSFDITSE